MAKTKTKKKKKKTAKVSPRKAEYIAYLEETLIPDLKESGKEFTAEDFETMVKFLRGAEVADEWSKERYIEFLEETLIPDLKESGAEYTAEDFQRGVSFLKRMKNPGGTKGNTMSGRKQNLSCAPGQNLIKRKGYTTKDGTRVAKTEFCIEDQGTKGVRSRGAKQGPFKGEKPWITREGKLGGPGYTKKPAKERHKLLESCMREYGFASCRDSLQVLLRNSEIKPKTRKTIESDVKWIEKNYEANPGEYQGNPPVSMPDRPEVNPQEVRKLKAKLLR